VELDFEFVAPSPTLFGIHLLSVELGPAASGGQPDLHALNAELGFEFVVPSPTLFGLHLLSVEPGSAASGRQSDLHALNAFWTSRLERIGVGFEAIELGRAGDADRAVLDS